MSDSPSSDTSAIDSAEKSGLPLISPDEREQEDELDNIVPTRGYNMLPVVALGGSAGGITALKEFFENTPPTTGLAYVVVLHLAPGHVSTLPELLQHHSKMPVHVAGDEEKLEANTVYVIPPGKHLTCTNGHLRLTELHANRGQRVAVDLFFRSLADTHGPHAMAVVLSGADGDGATGLRRIKERGGLTIAQDPEEAEHTGMPRSAIETGMVDWVLRVAQMPERLMAYHASEGRLRLPPEEGPEPAHRAEPPPPGEPESLLREVLAFLRTRTGCDFSYYKRATIVRRISRRMQVNGVEEMGDYLSFLRTHPGEAGALQNDLLISVTNFFRDREAFETLEEHLPKLFTHKGPKDTVRVWTPACATGEEAYSMAILLLEQARMVESPPILQVFGCDLNDDAIQTARAGFYPESIAADVSKERLRRFFVKEPGGYRVRRDLREMVLFASHDLLKDAPFSRMDLVSCRNLLIYLNRDAQKRALEIFHFSLKPGGLLFLGSSESVEEGATLFATVDKKRRIYRHVTVPRIGLPVPAGASVFQRTLQQHERLKYAHAALSGRAFSGGLLPDGQEAIPAAEDDTSANEVHFKLLGRFGPPSLVVNAQNEIVHLSENANRFLQFPEGEPTRNLLRLVHPMLRVELRAALLRAGETGEAVEIFRRIVDLPGGLKAVDIRVVPAGDLAPGFLLVLFEAHEPGGGETADAHPSSGALEPEAVVQQLDRELARANSNLRATVEQYEAATEELKASNEELQAMNEELRSAGEELETSREELQSVNEELTTVNAELRSRVEELRHANSDLQNLMASTEIATIFLDRALHVMLYTPTAVPLFHLIPGDVGRPITDLRHQLNYPELAGDAEQVLRTLVPVKREVREDGHWLLARVQPYRTAEDQIAGVALTFVDITEIKATTAAVAASEEEFRRAIEDAPIPVIMHAEDGQVLQISKAWTDLTGYTTAEIPTFDAWLIRISGSGAVRSEIRRLFSGEIQRMSVDLDVTIHDGAQRHWSFSASAPGTLRDGRRFIVGMALDVTERKQAEKALRESLEQTGRARTEAEAASKAKDHFLAVLSHELRTPLTPVLMAVDLLGRMPGMPDEAAEELAMIRRNVEVEADLIKDLLDVTRIGRGKFEITPVPLDFYEVICQAVDVSQADFDGKKQRLTVALEATKHRVNGDHSRLLQVVWNLLKNASKFTPEGGEIQARTFNRGGTHIVLEIADTGMGFKPEALTRIFEPFAQGSAETARRYGGLGLGLTIARAAVDAHGGEMHARSAGPDKGATFTVVLPLCAEP